MKRSSSSYRLQLIKEIATRQEHEHGASSSDPMASYIKQLLSDTPDMASSVKPRESKKSFSGTHFDEQAGGWVSDRWTLK